MLNYFKLKCCPITPPLASPTHSPWIVLFCDPRISRMKKKPLRIRLKFVDLYASIYGTSCNRHPNLETFCSVFQSRWRSNSSFGEACSFVRFFLSNSSPFDQFWKWHSNHFGRFWNLLFRSNYWSFSSGVACPKLRFLPWPPSCLCSSKLKKKNQKRILLSSILTH